MNEKSTALSLILNIMLNRSIHTYLLCVKSFRMRSLGSAALNMCHVARGDSDCYVEYGIHCWDMAASSVVLEEAGGFCADPKGNVPLQIVPPPKKKPKKKL